LFLKECGANVKVLQAKGLLVLASISWGLGNVAQKTILSDLGAFAATGLTCLLGAVILAPFAFQEVRYLPPIPQKGRWQLLVVSILFTGSASLMQFGYGGTSITNAGFMVNTSAVLTPLAAWVLFKERPAPMVWLAGPLTLAGIYLMGGASIFEITSGDWLCLAAAFLFSIWVPVIGCLLTNHGRPIFITTIQFLICGITSLVAATQVETINFVTIEAVWPEIIIMGIFSKGIAYLLMATAQQKVDSATASIIVSGEALFGSLFAYLFLQEFVGYVGLAGAALIFLAIVVLSLEIDLFFPKAKGYAFGNERMKTTQSTSRKFRA
jgi:drug/metabolite transporter (DMT)-like permease